MMAEDFHLECTNTGSRQTTLTKDADPKESWVFKTFYKRECGRFVASKKDKQSCCCGRPKGDHDIDALLPPAIQDTRWVPNRHTVLHPTDAYGEIEFQGAGQASRAKYIRVAHDTDPELVLHLLCAEWKLDLPKLLISVTGGAKSFVLNPKMKRVLREGLLKAAQTTGAWIITGGTNTGVMRHVGEAVRGHTVMSRGEQLKNTAHQVHLIGIASWGIVDHRELLVDAKDIVSYHMTSSMQSQGACLDNNHSHFILVDNGTEGQYGGEISFRASLENTISTKKMARSCEKTHGVPVVLLVLEGGPNTIRTVLESVTRNPAVPVVIAEGSGRAADILAFAHRFIAPSGGQMNGVADVVEHQQLFHKIEKAFPEADKAACVQMYNSVIQCVCRREFMTVFSVDEEGLEVDKAILRALLKSQHSQAADRLSLALVWDRADIAKTEIFTDDQKWEIPVLESAMMEALQHDRVEFVDLLLENGVSMSYFLTTKRLEDLYRENATISNGTLYHLLRKCKAYPSFSMPQLNNLINSLLGVTFKTTDCQTGALDKGLGILHARALSPADEIRTAARFRSPYNELMVWSVLCNRHKMAMFMWERGDECLAKALVAGLLYKQIAQEMCKDELLDLSEELETQSKEFYDKAYGLLDECYRADEEMAQTLLIYHLENWGGQTCLSLAVAMKHEEFVAHSCCQTKLTEIWMGAMRSGNWSSLKTVLGIIVPPVIFSLEFKSRADLCRMPGSYGDYQPDPNHREPDTTSAKTNHAYAGSQVMFTRNDGNPAYEGEPNIDIRSPLHHSNSTSSLYRRLSQFVSRDPVNDMPKAKLGLLEKVFEFYSAPITKFWGNLIVYLMFLMVFSHVILIKLSPVPSVEEWILIGFVSTLLLEEIRQVVQSESVSVGRRFGEWASNYWNLCDGVAVSLFFVAVAMRLNPNTLRIGHMLYSLDIMLWIIRLLDIFSVSKNLGPYVVMIGRMTVDMFYFLIIMVVFLLAYGVAQQAILFPYEQSTWELIPKIFFRPYFQVYGELFIEDVDYSVNTTETAFKTPKYDEYGGRLVTVIMAFYLLVANILLLNLLIAIFNNTFSEVEKNSNQIWKFQRYQLIMEYRQRPVLVPPFIVFAHACRLFNSCWRRQCPGSAASRQQEHQLKLFLSKEYHHKLMLFEEQCTESFLRRKAKAFHATQEERVRGIADKVDSMGASLQEVLKAMHAYESRQNRIEEYVLQILNVVGHLQLTIPGSMMSLSEFDEDRHSELSAHAQDRQDLYARGTSYDGYAILDDDSAPKIDRMHSMPEYMHQKTTSPQKSPTMLFRKKLPLTNPYQYKKQFTANTRRESVQHAVRKFKRVNSVPAPSIGSQGLEKKKLMAKLSSNTDNTDGGSRSSSVKSRVHVNRSGSEEVTCDTEDVTINLRPRSSTMPAGLRHRETYLGTVHDLSLHIRARQTPYPQSNQQRYPVPDFLVDWQMPFPGYFPDNYTDPSLKAQPSWADIDLLDPLYLDVQLSFNAIDHDGVDRRSHMGDYDLFDGIPRNPMGRTGLVGRGLLGRWGPNHAADPIVTRWKRNDDIQPLLRTGKKVLEFVAIQRRDSKEWAIPGGMMEVGDTISKTLKKEFFEEALGSLEESEEKREEMAAKLNEFFSKGIEVYKGYVDDPRNTDNAWIETAALNFHDETGDILHNVNLKAGDDACGVRWQEVCSHNKLYANHTHFLERVAELHGAFF